ncbi:MAG TPA: hypothetical protein VLT16_02440 [Candidatus Limnocylindrales bacterium]|nr:hypothetical protein [Candidatus Limnocylindrales bacterium]
MLHITNGESVAGTLRESGLPGSSLSWIDVLHDGPVPQTSSLSELSDIRARALAGFGWGVYDQIRARFAERDRVLEGFGKHEEVVLWFEHDLFDQLQLIQLLAWFSARVPGPVRLSLIQIGSFPGVEPFYGLGELNISQLSQLFPSRKTVSPSQLAIGREAWQAFCAPAPGPLLEFTRNDLPEMPFLRAALGRFFQEYPWRDDGLSRTQRQVLMALSSGARSWPEIYNESRKLEAVPWGDLSVYWRLEDLIAGPAPAIQKHAGRYELTDSGRQLLAGKADWVNLRGGIDTWLGGVHLFGPDAEWRWDEKSRGLQH